MNGRWRDARWWARQALRLYPEAWRERYGAELADTLAAHRVRPRTVIDITCRAMDAHLHRDLVEVQPKTAGQRAAVAPLGAFSAALIFGLAGLAMQQVHEPPVSWARFAAHHRLVQSLMAGSLALAVLAVAATAVALSIVIAAALWSGTGADRRDARRGVARAATPGAAWAALALLAEVLAAERPGAGTRPLRPVDVIAQLVLLASAPLVAAWTARHLRGVLRRAQAGLASLRASRRLLMIGQAAALASTAAAVPSLTVIARSNSQLLSAGWYLALVTCMATSLAWLVLVVRRARRCPPDFSAADRGSLG